jgi:hypothetical protein
MIQTMKECGPTIVLPDVRAFEEQVGIVLPESYVTFLLTYNGGRPSPRAFTIKGLPGNPYGVVQLFFGIGHKEESSNLDWNYQVFTDRLPNNLLPIACDDGGDLICLIVKGLHTGAVVFWDMCGEHEPPDSSIYPVSATFDDFLEAMQDLPEGPEDA